MLTTLRVLGRRIRGAAGAHAVATGLVAALLTGAAGVAIGATVVSHPASASAPPPSSSTPVPAKPSGSPGAAPAKKHKGSELVTALVKSTATQTGQTSEQVLAALRGGKTLNDIAGDKSAAVSSATLATVKTKLDASVTAGKTTAAQATTKLAASQTEITKDMTLPGPQVAAMVGGKPAKAKTSPAPSPTP